MPRIDEIVSLVNEIATTYQRVTDKSSAQQLKRTAEALRGVFDTIADNAEDLAASPDKRAKAISAISGQIQPDETMELQKFFENISTSLIEAQVALDRRSLDYAQQRDPRIPPSYFAIPNVRAEMKLGFSQMSQRGVNLVLFTRSEQKQQYGESTVTFDLVATPPPPGANIVPIPSFLVIDPERKALCDRILAKVRAGELARIANDLESSRGEAVVFRGVPQNNQPPSYLVLWPGPAIGGVRAKWKHFSLFHVLVAGEDLEFDISIYDKTHAPLEDAFLFLPTTEEINKDHADTAKLPLTTRLLEAGDILMNVAMLLNDWLLSIRRPAPAQNGPSAPPQA